MYKVTKGNNVLVNGDRNTVLAWLINHRFRALHDDVVFSGDTVGVWGKWVSYPDTVLVSAD